MCADGTHIQCVQRGGHDTGGVPHKAALSGRTPHGRGGVPRRVRTLHRPYTSITGYLGSSNWFIEILAGRCRGWGLCIKSINHHVICVVVNGAMLVVSSVLMFASMHPNMITINHYMQENLKLSLWVQVSGFWFAPTYASRVLALYCSLILTNYVARKGHDSGLVAAMSVSAAWDVFASIKTLVEPLNS